MNAHRFVPTALALALIAGAAASAQQATQPRTGDQLQQQRTGMQPGRTEAAASGTLFIPSEWALGADIVGTDGDTLGELNDLVLDAQGGKVTHAIISHGAVLGVGGKYVALPWQALKWNAEDRNFTLSMTADQLENAPEINKDRIGSQQRDGGRRFGMLNVSDERAQRNAWSAKGDYQKLVEQGRPTNVSGTVSSIDRAEPMQGMQEGIIITIGEDGRENIVHLGPAWFIDRQEVMLRLNDRVEIEGVQADLDGRTVVIAKTLSSPHGEFNLRDEQNKPVWDASKGPGQQQPGQQDRDRRNLDQQGQQGDTPRTRQVNQQLDQDKTDKDKDKDQAGKPDKDEKKDAGQQARQNGQAQPAIVPVAARGGNQPVDEQALSRAGGQMILVSDIEDQTLRSGGENDLGEIHALVFDALSGKAAFVVVGVGGFLGIGETNVAIPWNMIRVEPDNRLMAMNVDRDTLENAPRLEGDNWEQLGDRAFMGRVYQHFGQPNPFEGAQGQPMQPRQSGQQDQQQGAQKYNQLFASGQRSEVTGTVRTVSQAQPAGLDQPIVVAFIEEEGGERRTVHLAPRRFLDDVGLNIEQGNRLTIEGRTANVDGEQVLIASRVQKEGNTLELRGDDGVPKWNAQGR